MDPTEETPEKTVRRLSPLFRRAAAIEPRLLDVLLLVAEPRTAHLDDVDQWRIPLGEAIAGCPTLERGRDELFGYFLALHTLNTWRKAVAR